MKIYGIKNCDTMKKCFTFLEEQHLNFEFHDYKKNGLEKETFMRWTEQMDWLKLINSGGTTYKNLADEEKKQVQRSAEQAWLVVQKNFSILKRPILEEENKIQYIGFKNNALIKV